MPLPAIGGSQIVKNVFSIVPEIPLTEGVTHISDLHPVLEKICLQYLDRSGYEAFSLVNHSFHQLMRKREACVKIDNQTSIQSLLNFPNLIRLKIKGHLNITQSMALKSILPILTKLATLEIHEVSDFSLLKIIVEDEGFDISGFQTVENVFSIVPEIPLTEGVTHISDLHPVLEKICLQHLDQPDYEALSLVNHSFHQLMRKREACIKLDNQIPLQSLLNFPNLINLKIKGHLNLTESMALKFILPIFNKLAAIEVLEVSDFSLLKIMFEDKDFDNRRVTYEYLSGKQLGDTVEAQETYLENAKYINELLKQFYDLLWTTPDKFKMSLKNGGAYFCNSFAYDNLELFTYPESNYEDAETQIFVPRNRS